MKIICPEHNGVVEVSGAPFQNAINITVKNLVVECPICEEEVIINGKFDYDEQGNPSISNKGI